jgi:hypothetical protein
MKPLQLVFPMAVCLVFAYCTPARPGGSSSYAGPVATRSEVKKTTGELLNANTFKLTEVSTDETYGYSEKNAIQVGGARDQAGPTNERRFLNALLGPNGETVSFQRLGSCCAVKSKNALFGDMALLDKYEVTYDGLEKPIILYINMYDYSPLKAPKGFTFRE